MRHAAYAAAALLLACGAADAQTLTLTSVKDATIRGGTSAGLNFGATTILETRASSDPEYLRRTLVMFDTAAALPSNAQIASAYLVLTVAGGNPETRQLTACAVPVSFDEPTVTWKRRNASTAWTHAGGDVVASDCSSATVGAAVNSTVTFNVTAQVRKAVAGSYGSRYARFAVGDPGANSRDSYRQYYSHNYSGASVRPRLLITKSSTVSTTSTPPPATSTGGKALRVLQWNTHHGGVGTDGVYNPDRLINWAVKMQPDVIMFNEIEKNDSWGSRDQPAVYTSMLKAKTGKTWYYVFAQEFGQWTANGKGNMILSTVPFTFVDRYELVHNSDRSAAEAAITWNGRNITLMCTHLDPYSQPLRLLQATEVMSWAAAEPENRILTGDMNAWPNQTSIAQFNKSYYDSWSVALSKGTATSFSGNAGETKNGRIDYIFYSKSSASLSVASSRVYDTRDANGVMPSDHRPVLTVFMVK